MSHQDVSRDFSNLDLNLDKGAASNEGATEKKGLFKPEYVLVETEEALKECLKSLQHSLTEDPILAVDCEGDKLSRTGTLRILSVATRTKAFIVDIKALKAEPFEAGFRAILEDNDVTKLMFDCRQDSDALFHQFHVKLDGVLDIQLLEIIKRPEETPTRVSPQRSERRHEVVKLKGLIFCVHKIDTLTGIFEIKKRGIDLRKQWGERPLSTEALEYAATDVLALFHIFDMLKPNDEEMGRLEIASSIYVDLRRSKVADADAKFEEHGYLPIDVIPKKGQIGFEAGHTMCTACKRCFPSNEFSKTQLRNRIQMCRLCKRVKYDQDAREKRARAERESAWNAEDFSDYSD